MFKKLSSFIGAAIIALGITSFATAAFATGTPGALGAVLVGQGYGQDAQWQTIPQLLAGQSTATGGVEIRLYTSTTSTGNTADTTDDTLASYSLPANSFPATLSGQNILVTAFGTTGATANNKTIKLWFGSELITSGVITDNAGTWYAQLLIINGVAANAQIINGTLSHNTTSIAPLVTTGAETETAPILIKCTGASGTTGAANDVVLKGFVVEYLN